jgi:hypothetical protein
MDKEEFTNEVEVILSQFISIVDQEETDQIQWGNKGRSCTSMLKIQQENICNFKKSNDMLHAHTYIIR